MATETVGVDHIMVRHVCAVLRVDRGFSAIMRAEPAALVGRRLIELTAPEDRPACIDYTTRLSQSRSPVCVAKRLLRGDGSIVWIDKTVALAEPGWDINTPPPITATIVPIDDPDRFEAYLANRVLKAPPNRVAR